MYLFLFLFNSCFDDFPLITRINSLLLKKKNIFTFHFVLNSKTTRFYCFSRKKETNNWQQRLLSPDDMIKINHRNGG